MSPWCPLAAKAPNSQGTRNKEQSLHPLKCRNMSSLLDHSAPPYLVATLINDLQDVGGQRRVFPGSDGIGDLATFSGNAVVLAEDPPVPVCHLI